MAENRFVHLRVHSAYSLSEGAIPLETLGKMCVAQGMPAVAVTDTRNLFGALEFSTLTAREGVQPIVGCQIALRREDQNEDKGCWNRRDPAADLDHLVLLCRNAEGYGNLMSLVSNAFLQAEDGAIPQVGWGDLAARAAGLICLSGGIDGPISRLILTGRPEEAEAALLRLQNVFGDCLYVELQRHGLAAEDEAEPHLLDFAYRRGIPLAATNDCYFPSPDMYEAHDVLLCMAQKATISQEDRRRLTPHHCFKSAEDMRQVFADVPEAADNTLTIARRCAFLTPKVKPILPHAPCAAAESEDEALRRMAAEGLKKRLAVHVFAEGMDETEKEAVAKPYWERLERELDVIVKIGFSGYFIIVADFIQWAKNHGIPVGPGRGSGAGSAVAWALTITDLDPLRFRLLFERFLNPERVSMPDFDVDFCQERREEVIRYVRQAYGADRVAQIITFGKLQARAVLRSVGRVLEMPLGHVDKICKLVPNNPAKPVTLEEAIKQEPQLQALRDKDPQVEQLLTIGRKLEGLYSHASTHAAGVVIGDRPLDQLTPLYRDPHSDMPVTQFNMKWVEAAGLVKFDFLGLKTLTLLQRATDLLKRRGIVLDLSALPLDDGKTYEMLSRGETVGVFQLESQGMRDVLTKLKPDRLEDIVAVVALYRPGPMDNIPSYIARKRGDEPVDCMHPKLEPILQETYGIMIYQEQVMQAAQALAGYSLGGADLLRRAMGKKIKEEMDAQRAKFEEGCAEQGIARAQASEIFDTIAKFAGYGFNKSHAAAYAYVSYQTAYLKAHYPVEFLAASMTCDIQNTDKLAVFRAELERLRIPLLPPDVNRSGVHFTVECLDHPSGAVRYALSAVKNVGEAAMQLLVEEREKNGPFATLSAFADRLDTKAVNRRLLENLIRAGAFDALEEDRAKIFYGLDALVRRAQAAAEERVSQQANLFGGEDGKGTPPLELPEPPQSWGRTEALHEEKTALGFFLSAHPLDGYKTALARLDVAASSDLPSYLRHDGAALVKMAGVVVARKEKIGKNGARFAFVTFSDAGGSYEAMMFSEALLAYRPLLDAGIPLLLAVQARLEGEQMRLQVQQCEELDEAVSRITRKVTLYYDRADALEAVKRIMERDGRGRGRVVLAARLASREVEIALPQGFALNAGTLGALREAPGILHIQEI